MKTYSLLAAIAAVVVTGCGHKDGIVVNNPDGSSATITPGVGGTTINAVGKDGSKATETIDSSGVTIKGNGKDGSAATMTSNANGMTIQGTDKDGNKVNETINGNGMSASDGKGNTLNSGVGVVKESDLGLPFYPGSSETKDSLPSMVADDAKERSVISYRSTSDDPGKVIAFYKDKVPGGQPTSVQSGQGSVATLNGKLANGAEVTIMATSDGKKDTMVMVSVKTKKG